MSVSSLSPTDSVPHLLTSSTSQNLEKSSERPKFSQVVHEAIQKPGHKIVENFLVGMVRPNPNKQAYGQYLFNLHHDIEIVESLLKKAGLPIHSLPKLYFQGKIAADLENFEGEKNLYPQMTEYQHKQYYAVMQKKPHLLLTHFSIHALGLLAGGKILARMISPIWGSECTNLYTFPPDQGDLRSQFKGELDAYFATLTDEQFQEVQNEIDCVWNYVGDMTGNNIRPQLGSLVV
jgi:heme oxygenase